MPKLPRCTIAATTATALLALPGAALAAGTGASGTVLSAGAHSVQVVNAAHAVSGYGVRGRMPHLRAGSQISFTRSGATILHVRVTGHAKQLSYYARVVRTSGGHVVLRLADGRTVSFSSRQVKARSHKRSRKVHAAGDLSISIQGLQPGTSVLVTESVGGDGSISITITIQGPATGSGSGSGGGQGSGGDQGGDQSGDGSLDETGPITALSANAITIATPDHGAMTFPVDPTAGLLDGFLRGDVVDVTYTQNADGSYDVSDVEYVENDNTGVVTAVTPASVTITDDQTGRSETYVADPTQGVFDGIAVGDDIDLTWHQAAAGLQVADTADDLTQAGSPGSGDGALGDGTSGD